MNLRPPSVNVSTHISAFNAVAVQSPALPNAWMSLWTQYNRVRRHRASRSPQASSSNERVPPFQVSPRIHFCAPLFPHTQYWYLVDILLIVCDVESIGVYLHGKALLCCSFLFLFLFFNLTYSRWTSSLPSCLWSLRIFPSLPGSRLTIFYRDASSAILQLVN